jgi:hypothetical protein
MIILIFLVFYSVYFIMFVWTIKNCFLVMYSEFLDVAIHHLISSVWWNYWNLKFKWISFLCIQAFHGWLGGFFFQTLWVTALSRGILGRNERGVFETQWHVAIPKISSKPHSREGRHFNPHTAPCRCTRSRSTWAWCLGFACHVSAPLHNLTSHNRKWGQLYIKKHAKPLHAFHNNTKENYDNRILLTRTSSEVTLLTYYDQKTN